MGGAKLDAIRVFEGGDVVAKTRQANAVGAGDKKWCYWCGMSKVEMRCRWSEMGDETGTDGNDHFGSGGLVPAS